MWSKDMTHFLPWLWQELCHRSVLDGDDCWRRRPAEIRRKRIRKIYSKMYGQRRANGKSWDICPDPLVISSSREETKIRLSLATRAAGSLLFSLVCFDNRE